MKRLLLLASAACLSIAAAADPPQSRSDKEALQPFNDLIGAWRCTGKPSGTREQQQDNFWTEGLAVEWQFKGPSAWLKIDFTNSKHFHSGELRPLPEAGRFQLDLVTTDKKQQRYVGQLDKRTLTLERPEQHATARLVFTFLHHNRFLYRYETQPAGKTLAVRHWHVGATKEGVPFASGAPQPECIVTGGLGTSTVTHQGKTYYVCCSGCRTEFYDNPEFYIKEFEAKQNKKKAGAANR